MDFCYVIRTNQCVLKVTPLLPFSPQPVWQDMEPELINKIISSTLHVPYNTTLSLAPLRGMPLHCDSP